MKQRNPLFVAGFPYILIIIGYIGMQVVSFTQDEGSEPNGLLLVGIFAFLGLLFVGTAYTLYWLISTARVLRRETGQKIPYAILLVIPLANYWWMWRYSQAAEIYTKNKHEAALLFILIALLGSIGNGILQDVYNKTTEVPAPAPAPAPLDPTLPPSL